MSRYDLFRRRIAPVAFLLAIALIARDSCEKDQRTHTTMELDFGDARAQVRAVDVDVVAGGEGKMAAKTEPTSGDAPFAHFHRAALGAGPIGPCRFEVAVPGDDGELRIDVDLGGAHRRFTRRFHAIEGSTMVVPIGPEIEQPR